MEILSVETHYFCKESHKKEVQLGKVSKRWEGVNLKTYFFKVKNKGGGQCQNVLIFFSIFSNFLKGF